MVRELRKKAREMGREKEKETGTETETKARGGENQISTKVYELSVYHTYSYYVLDCPLFSPVRSV